MEEQNTNYAIAVNSTEWRSLSLCQNDKPNQQYNKQSNNEKVPIKPFSSPIVQKIKSVSCSGT